MLAASGTVFGACDLGAAPPPKSTRPPSPVIAAAGDIACYRAPEVGASRPPRLVVETRAASGLATQTVTPVADSYVERASPRTNHGSSVAIRADGSPPVIAYLRFDLAGVTGTVTRATLEVDAESQLSTGVDLHAAADDDWAEETITYANAPRTGARAATSLPVTAGTTVSLDATRLVAGGGSATLAIKHSGPTAVAFASREVAGEGDKSQCRQKYTSDLLLKLDLTAVLTLGDNQYEDGALAAYRASYHPSWGRVKSITHPVPGNHEYLTPGAAGYFDYFGAQAGERNKGYYAFDVGKWRLYAINSNCSQVGGCGAGSPQLEWLKADLAANPRSCALAYSHHPRFSSGQHGSFRSMAVIWRTLDAAGAELFLSGHDHNYERFAPQSPAGRSDLAKGIRQFVVGTGGKNPRPLRSEQPNSEVRNDDAFGVLELKLHPKGYEWRFVPEQDATFTDSGSGACH